MIALAKYRKIYFDTNILDFTRTAELWEDGEKDPNFHESKIKDITKNVIALRYILDLDKEWNLIFGTSRQTEKELIRIFKTKPFKYFSLATTYETLRKLSSKQFERDTRRNKLSKEQEKQLRYKLAQIIKNQGDVEHLVNFANSGWDVFLTLDMKHILNKKRKVKDRLKNIGLDVCSPLDFLADFMQCNDGEEALNLIRTALHGSWAKSYIINNPE